jgi:excinuclease UvrABC nuclease subunit
MKATKFFKPYNKESYALKSTGKGVYVIKEKGKIVYVGLSYSDLQKTLYRHFQKWTDKRSAYTKKAQLLDRVTYADENRDNYLIKVIFCKTIKEVTLLEYLLIKKLKPRDNISKKAMYDNEDLSKISYSLNNAETWKSNLEEAPF